MFRIPLRPATNLVRWDQLSWPGSGLRKAVSSHTLFSNCKASSREWVKRRWGVGSCIVRTLFSPVGQQCLQLPLGMLSTFPGGCGMLESTLRLFFFFFFSFCMSWLATATENVPPEGAKLLWSGRRRLQSPHLSGLLGCRVGIMVQSGCF